MLDALHGLLEATVGQVLDLSLMARAVPGLLEGAVVTAQLMSFSLFFGFIFALVLAGMRLSGNRLADRLADGYIFVFRGTPLLVQLFLIYYGLSQFDFIRESALWPILREPFWCAIAALTLNTAAYTAEIIRGAVLAVPESEIEAARAIGMSKATIYRRVIAPHAIRTGVPAYANEVILLLKGSALVSAITLMDIAGQAQRLYTRTYAPFEPLISAGIMYLLLTFAITRIAVFVEFSLTPAGARWRKRWAARLLPDRGIDASAVARS